MSTKIQITLSSANMGPQATEADFDAWVAYVAREIDEALGIDAEVDQFAFTGPGFEGEDAVSGGTAEQREDVKKHHTKIVELCEAIAKLYPGATAKIDIGEALAWDGDAIPLANFVMPDLPKSEPSATESAS